MSEQLSFDRKKGFVALPVQVLDLDLSPGAFRTLVELCRMANAEGFCWPSLDQLSTRLGRSKSAISGYLKDLRRESLIETEEQKTATGYNYRLKYRVTFWQDWRASLTGTTRPKPERSVQPTERLKESKNHIHKNHPAPAAKEDLDMCLKDWARCFGKAPYPAVCHLPSNMLLDKTAKLTSKASDQDQIISADIARDLTALWHGLGLKGDADLIKTQGAFMQSQGYSRPEFDAVLSAIRRNWPAHWRKIPSPEHLQKLTKSAGIVSREQKLTLLSSYEKRWRLARKTLQFDPQSGHLDRAEPTAFCAVG